MLADDMKIELLGSSFLLIDLFVIVGSIKLFHEVNSIENQLVGRFK